MRATLILNLRSSGTERHRSEIPAQLAARGITLDEVITLDDNSQIDRRVRRAVKRGAKTVILGGGDGTMTLAMDALAHRKTVLGVLPLGTGNSFAKSLGIPSDIAGAIGVIASRRDVRVDLGVMNGRHFANFATIGLSAEVAASTSHDLKRVIGPAAYAVAGAKPLFTHHDFEAKIRWKRGALTLRTQHIIIASGRYFGASPVLPDASITSGKLALFTSSGTTPIDVLRTYAAFALDRQTRLPDAHTLSAKEITIKTKGKELVNLDGDPAGKTPARFSIDPRALRVFAPVDFVDDGD